MRWFLVLLAFSLLACGSSSSGGSSATGGSSAAGSGGTSGAGAGGLPGSLDRRPPECRFEPASVTLPDSTNPWESFVQTWVYTICTNLEPCCTTTTFDFNACNVYYRSLLSSLSSGDPQHYAYDPPAGQACLDEIQTELATCSTAFGGACTQVARGLLHDGEVCVNNRDCASGACSTVGDRKECGAGAVHGAVGDPCAESCVLDAYGAAFCFGQPSQATIGQCYAEDGVYCALNGALLGPNDGSGAHCAALLARGAPCQSYWECVDGVCSGGVCSTGSDVGGACPCKPNLVCSANSCGPGRSAGEPCDFADNACASGLLCTDGACQCGGYYGSYLMPAVCEY